MEERTGRRVRAVGLFKWCSVVTGVCDAARRRASSVESDVTGVLMICDEFDIRADLDIVVSVRNAYAMRWSSNCHVAGAAARQSGVIKINIQDSLALPSHRHTAKPNPRPVHMMQAAKRAAAAETLEQNKNSAASSIRALRSLSAPSRTHRPIDPQWELDCRRRRSVHNAQRLTKALSCTAVLLFHVDKYRGTCKTCLLHIL